MHSTAQKIPDTLSHKSNEELLKAYETIKEVHKKEIYIKAYLKKGKINKDTASIVKGYSSLCDLSEGKKRIEYADSIIQLTKHNPDSIFPAFAYITKGYGYYQSRKWKSSLDNHLIANKYAQQYYNMGFLWTSTHSIGVLKDRIGYSKEALQIHKQNLKLAEKKSDEAFKLLFTSISTHAIAFTYKNLRKLDSALFYNNFGKEKASKLSRLTVFNQFLLNEGVIYYHDQKIKEALGPLEKATKYFEEINDKPNKAEGYFYLAKIHKDLKQEDKAIEYLKKVDTIFIEINDLLPEIREGYEMLIEYYKKKENTESQLLYLERLISLDSVLNDNYRHVSRNISQKYDTPRLMKEKEKIITYLQKENTLISSRNIIISLFLTISFFVIGYYYYQQRIYKKRFLKLFHKTDPPIQKNDHSKHSSINQKTLQKLLAQLQKFEEQKGFLKSNINSRDLAKSFGSNSSYLSVVINNYKKKSISNYINDLRIDFAVDQLQSNLKFRKYTIKAIAQEMGFNNAEAFAKAFYKKTGIYPSYFIKNLEKTKIDNIHSTKQNMG